MPRICTICSHPEKEAIDKALVAGQSLRDLSALYRVSEDSLTRHKSAHLAATLAQAQEAADVAHADDLLGEIRKLQKVTQGILARTATTGDYKTALSAIREARGNLEMLGKLLGELQEPSNTVNVLISPGWLSLRAAILEALLPYPEARLALAEKLRAYDAAPK